MSKTTVHIWTDSQTTGTLAKRILDLSKDGENVISVTVTKYENLGQYSHAVSAIIVTGNIDVNIDIKERGWDSAF